jgi:hypothetical protein
MPQVQQTKLPLFNSLLSNTLNERNSFRDVVDISMGYNTPFLSLVNVMNMGNSKQIGSAIYEFAKRDNLAVSTQISAAAQSGLNLVLTLSDPAFNQFRKGDKVMDTEWVKAVVLTSGPGNVTIEPFGTPLVAGTQFAAGQYIKVIGDASPNRDSRGKESLYNTPIMDFNFYSTKRDSVYLALEDMIDTYVRYKGQSWYFDQEMDMIRRAAKNMESDFIVSDRLQVTTSQGLTNSNGGLKWSIINRGGTYVKSNNLLDIDIFNQLLLEVASKNSAAQKEVTCMAGEAAMQIIHKFINEIGKFSGKNNTFGGQIVHGLQYNEYAIGSISLKLVPFPTFNDPVLFPELSAIGGAQGTRQSNALFMIDSSPNKIVGGGDAPSIELFHFGKEMYYGHIKGMAAAGADVSDFMNPADTIISSDIDGISAQWLVRNGINITNAKGMVYFELGQ